MRRFALYAVLAVLLALLGYMAWVIVQMVVLAGPPG